MKALTRPTPAPPHLSNFTGGLHHWSQVTLSYIWPSLQQMQAGFCAYCECSLDDKKHVEHFRPRKHFPKLTFRWDNLFGSCCGTQRCGTFKDNGAGQYNPDELIKPDVDDPDDYLLFLTTGKVIPAQDLEERDLRKAEETIRVFNLNNDPALFGRRRTALSLELENVQELHDAKNYFSEEEWLELLKPEIERACQMEFSTALKHAWRFNIKYE